MFDHDFWQCRNLQQIVVPETYSGIDPIILTLGSNHYGIDPTIVTMLLIQSLEVTMGPAAAGTVWLCRWPTPGGFMLPRGLPEEGDFP